MTKATIHFLTLAIATLVIAACTPAPDPTGATESDSAGASEPEIRTVWIPMEDGIRLAADIFMPTDAVEAGQYPVLLEYLPYRKDES
ncbi:MAG: CocE/NonD family hydrolase, partial [Woeseiaceae bacterium]